MTFQVVGALGALAAIVGVLATAFFFGGRRWRSNYEAEHVRAERLQATLIEKDVALEAKDEQLAGMSGRLARMDEERKEYGGSKVYEALLTQQQENAQAFRQLGDHLVRHEERMVHLIETVGRDLVKCINGGSR